MVVKVKCDPQVLLWWSWRECLSEILCLISPFWFCQGPSYQEIRKGIFWQGFVIT